MRRNSQIVAWLLLGVAGAALLAWAFPRVYPRLPESWRVGPAEAEATAMALFEDLGPAVEDPLVITRLESDRVLDRRLWQTAREGGAAVDRPGTSRAAAGVLAWEVTVFAPAARADEWTYRAWITPGGEVAALRRNMRADEGEGAVDPEAARERADAFLRRHGFELTDFDPPEARSRQLTQRTDLTLRYRDREELFGPDIAYGVEVAFAGAELLGFSRYLEDPEAEEVRDQIQGFALLDQLWIFLPVLLVPVVAVFFLRRYHQGEVGVRRGLKLFALSFASGLVFLAFCAVAVAVTWGFGISMRQMIGIAVFQLAMLYFLPLGAIAFLSWSVGEVLCRERSAHRLAAFDALFKGRLGNATVAWASLRGLTAGIAVAGGMTAGAWLLGEAGAVWAPTVARFGPWWDGTSWFGLALLGFTLPTVLYHELFGRLLLVSAASRWLGTWGGSAAAVLAAAVLFFPPLVLVPLSAGLLLAAGVAAVAVFLFLRFGLATVLLASLTSSLLLHVYAFLLSGHPWLQFQATLPLLAVALPFLASLRHLGSEEEFTYRYDDVPAHVRRIAERERQRIELETARRIQSSILPELPPSLHGVELAHAYLPATEVGGDFYDVLGLEDGRLALAIGDVAGHGVSSGLVMSAAKSALAVQVTFNPDVQAVFRTLNRVVYQSARKRLLATLCYALLDPARRELLYASAGHLYPYLISAGPLSGGARVTPLEYVSYPLGVRGEVTVDARLARLAPGDTLFLLSDGLVEARPEGSDDLFGFERLEQSLARHAHLSVPRLRDAVLADVDRHARGAPREDDQTVLVLRVP